MAASQSDKILGVVLIVLGALMLLGWLRVPYLTTLIAIALIVVGILMLMGKAAGATWLAVLLIILGVLLLLRGMPFVGDLSYALSGTLNTIIAIILIVVGVLKVIGKM